MAALVVLVLLAQQPPPARLSLQHLQGDGAGACPDQAWLEANVAARLGYHPFTSEAPLQARTRFECAAGACTATLELQRGEGTPRRRLLALPDCDELAQALALSLALAIDPLRASRPPAQVDGGVTPGRAPAPLEARAVNPGASGPGDAGVPESAPAVTPPESLARWSGFAQVGAHGTAGLSPFLNGGARVAVGARVGPVSMALEARVDLPQAIGVEGGSVVNTAVMGTLAPCLHWRAFGGCLVVSVGALGASGQLGAGQAGTVWLALLGGRVSWEYPLRPWLAVVAQLTLQAPLARVRVVANDAAVWASWPVVPELGAAAKVRW